MKTARLEVWIELEGDKAERATVHAAVDGKQLRSTTFASVESALKAAHRQIDLHLKRFG